MNDRLIKESDVLKAIDKRIKELSKHPEFIRKNGHIDVIGVKKYILAIPSADRPQEWIPCSERMPEYRKIVLISTFWGVKTGFLDNTEAYGDFWEIIENDATTALHNIYAWMPLPKPWKGADDGEDVQSEAE